MFRCQRFVDFIRWTISTLDQKGKFRYFISFDKFDAHRSILQWFSLNLIGRENLNFSLDHGRLSNLNDRTGESLQRRSKERKTSSKVTSEYFEILNSSWNFEAWRKSNEFRRWNSSICLDLNDDDDEKKILFVFPSRKTRIRPRRISIPLVEVAKIFSSRRPNWTINQRRNVVLTICFRVKTIRSTLNRTTNGFLSFDERKWREIFSFSYRRSNLCSLIFF